MLKVESVRLVPRRSSAGNGNARASACLLDASEPPGEGSEARTDGEALLALLASGDPPAFATDSRDRIVFWNRGMADLLGLMSHSVLGQHCYETLAGRDVFGNRFCYANCAVLASTRQGEPVCAFELNVATASSDRRPLGLTILKIPGARPDLFTLVHIVRPILADSRLAGMLARLEDKGVGGPARSLPPKPPLAPPPPLTRREIEVLRHLASGLQNKEVAQRLGLSLATVRNHVHNILDKLGVHSKLEAVSLSFRNGWVALDEMGALVKMPAATAGERGA